MPLPCELEAAFGSATVELEPWLMPFALRRFKIALQPFTEGRKNSGKANTRRNRKAKNKEAEKHKQAHAAGRRGKE